MKEQIRKHLMDKYGLEGLTISQALEEAVIITENRVMLRVEEDYRQLKNEISSLKARLYHRTSVASVAEPVRVCQEKDIECGNSEKNWCASCPKKLTR